MRSMSRVERFFERLVERPSARLFRTRLQPIQVLRRIERAMEASRGSEVERNVVPEAFSVRVNPDDLATLPPLETLAADLASEALAFARTHQLALRDRPRVTFHADPAVRRGEVEVEVETIARTAQPAHDELVTASPAAAASETRVFQVPVVRAPTARLEIREPHQAARFVSVTGRPLRIGRSRDCDVVLRDARASRQHARLQGRDGVLVLTDLGSTNGTRVNGRRVREIVLGIGDRIELGDTILTLAPDAGDEPGPRSAGTT